ncbi:MAG TPA: T9SS type A sorting domain-containing protein, partial [Chitinophagaceae bacterium]|nr:T9SS type A sorting domain-containing protein [Chitinophagaceae bacterium]
MDIQNDNFKIYPNPSLRGSSAVIEFESLNQENSQVRIFSINGQLVKALPVYAVKGKNKLQVNIDSRWPAGTYIFQL